MKLGHLTILATGMLLALASTGVSAQSVYRIVGPDGRVTFSDTPPPSGATPTPTRGSAAAADAGLPYELQQIARRYPVTLYSGNNCAPCASGRALLQMRGIPFSERTVTSPEDVQALQRLSGEAGLPLLTIGSQQLKGFSDAEWTQYLDAAGYPKSSKLPAGYAKPAPAPLVAVERPTVPAPAEPPPAAAQEPGVNAPNVRPRPAVAPRPASDPNPAGIRF